MSVEGLDENTPNNRVPQRVRRFLTGLALTHVIVNRTSHRYVSNNNLALMQAYFIGQEGSEETLRLTNTDKTRGALLALAARTSRMLSPLATMTESEKAQAAADPLNTPPDDGIKQAYYAQKISRLAEIEGVSTGCFTDKLWLTADCFYRLRQRRSKITQALGLNPNSFGPTLAEARIMIDAAYFYIPVIERLRRPGGADDNTLPMIPLAGNRINTTISQPSAPKQPPIQPTTQEQPTLIKTRRVNELLLDQPPDAQIQVNKWLAFWADKTRYGITPPNNQQIQRLLETTSLIQQLVEQGLTLMYLPDELSILDGQTKTKLRTLFPGYDLSILQRRLNVFPNRTRLYSGWRTIEVGHRLPTKTLNVGEIRTYTSEKKRDILHIIEFMINNIFSQACGDQYPEQAGIQSLVKIGDQPSNLGLASFDGPTLRIKVGLNPTYWCFGLVAKTIGLLKS